MNRAFYIVGIVFSVVFLFVTAYYAEEVNDARFEYLYSDLSSYGYDNPYSYYSGSSYQDLTFEASLWSLFFFLTFITVDLLGLLKVKTTTTKVLSIIGLCLSGLFLLWNFAVMASPGGLSFNEVSPGWAFYCLVMLAFGIVGLVQSVRYHKRLLNGEPVAGGKESKDLLDS